MTPRAATPLEPCPLPQRFWDKVSPEPNSGCWLWTGSLIGNRGYGKMWDGARLLLAHVFAYQRLIGPVPEGLELDHKCRIRSCVNPDHLEAVSHRTNNLRGNGPTAQNARKTHCRRGHEFTPENTAMKLNGDGKRSRACRRCLREAKRKEPHQ